MMVVRRVLLITLLFLVSPQADSPVTVWELVPTGWKRVPLCLDPCDMHAGHVTGYEWRIKDAPDNWNRNEAPVD